MAEMTKEDWYEWCQSPVTKDLFDTLSERISSETWTLVETAGQNPQADARISGQVMAFGEIINWKPDAIKAMDKPVDEGYVGGFDES